jgi:hypothetical protein
VDSVDNVDMLDMVHGLVALASMQLPARHAFGIPLLELGHQTNSFHRDWENCVLVREVYALNSCVASGRFDAGSQPSQDWDACTANPTHLIDRVASSRKIMFIVGIRGRWRL